MKRNHIKAMSLIQQAIQACGDDFSVEAAKSYLKQAIAIIQDVGGKRLKKQNSQAEKFAELAKSKNEKWWKMIVEGAKKSAEAALQKKIQDNNGGTKS